MILTRYIFKEAVLTWLAVVLVVLLISLSTRFVQYLADVAVGVLPGDVVFTLIALKAMTQLELILPFAFYLSLLLTFSRLYKDSEMVALSASGVGGARLVWMTFVFSLPVAAVVAALSLYLGPWAAEQDYRVREQALRSLEIKTITAGQFREAQDGDLVVYVEQIGPDRKTMENVFVQSRLQGELGVLSSAAATSYVDEETGDRFVVLRNGRRYDGSPGDPKMKIIEFEKYAVRIDRALKPIHRKQVAIPTSELIGSRAVKDGAELQWRISMPVSTLLLALLALPLSRVTAREGRYAKVITAVLVYIIYNNMLGVTRDMVKNGELPAHLGMWWVHVTLLVLVIVLLIKQSGLRWLVQRATGQRASTREGP